MQHVTIIYDEKKNGEDQVELGNSFSLYVLQEYVTTYKRQKKKYVTQTGSQAADPN